MVDVIKTVIPKVTVKQEKQSVVHKGNGETTGKKGRFKRFSGSVKCAICEEMMPNVKWTVHKETKHNNLTWREGEEPLDLEDHKLVVKLLTLLYKQKKPLRCENCGEKKKSVIGFISHKQQCQKSEEELDNLKVTCELCHRTMLPVSMPVHMQLYHSGKPSKKVEEEGGEMTVLTPRQAAKKANHIIKNLREVEFSSGFTKTGWTRRIVKDVDFTLNDEVLNKFRNDINANSYAKCVYENCPYQSEIMDDLMEHLSSCDKKIQETAFTCNYCLATYANRKDALQHFNEHSNKMDIDYIFKKEDTDFVVEGEEQVDDPLEYLDDEIACDVGPGCVTLAKGTFAMSKAKFMQCVHSYKNPWSLLQAAYNWTKKYVLDNYNNEHLFPHCCCYGNHYKAVSPKDILSYLPKLRQSADVARVRIQEVQNPVNQTFSWRRYKLFEADMSSDGTATIFCGGPVTCLAWTPTPHVEVDQILCVSVLPDPDLECSTTANHFDKSLIQFWNFGPLSNGVKSNITPSLEFCVAHKYGLVFNLEWCPSGCYDSSSESENVEKRLGLLAVASGDSLVYVYAIPQPKQIKGKVLECEPLCRLSLSKVDANIGDTDYFPTKTSWTKHKGHMHIAVGYSNGLTSLYSLEKLTENTFGKEIITLYPLQCFNAHLESITALALSHLSGGNRFLLTGSVSKDLKLWDLEDTTEPIYVNRKCPVADFTWNIHWITPVVCYDSLNSMASCLMPLRDHNGTNASLVPYSSRLVSMASNDWGNIYLHCSDAGEVVSYTADQLNEKYDAEKKRKRPRYLLSYTGIISKSLSSDENKAVQNNILKQMKDKKVTPENVIYFGPQTYADVKNNYGLIFCDMDTTTHYLEGPASEHNKLLQGNKYHSVYKPEQYPMQSVNKVVLNQNMQSFQYYALGYQVGFVRVAKLGFLNK